MEEEIAEVVEEEEVAEEETAEEETAKKETAEAGELRQSSTDLFWGRIMGDYKETNTGVAEEKVAEEETVEVGKLGPPSRDLFWRQLVGDYSTGTVSIKGPPLSAIKPPEEKGQGLNVAKPRYVYSNYTPLKPHPPIFTHVVIPSNSLDTIDP